MKINIQKLKETEHMFQWLTENPFDEIVTSIEEMFQEQVPSTVMEQITVLSEPQWLSGGTKDENNQMELVRCAVAFLCEFTLTSDIGTHHLKGVFTWVGVNMNNNNRQLKKWIDLDGTLDEFGENGKLKERIYMEL